MTVAGEQGRRKRATAPVSKADASATRHRRRGPVAAAAARVQPDPAVLLAWYDRHRRRLPWRAGAGEAADPYRVWLSEIMLQQTTVRAVEPYFREFVARWPTVAALAAAPLEDVLKAWAGLGYYARARNLHACARTVAARHGGCFPAEVNALRALPGIGAYTAAAIAAIAFGRRATAIDGNVERVIARLYAIEEERQRAKPVVRRLAEALTPAARSGDFAQAMMDLGATICTPRKPACVICPWNEPCAGRRRDPESFPRRAPKRAAKLRTGAAFWVTRADGRVLVRTRPASGLLGGMTEVPTSAWAPGFDAGRRALAGAPLRANWRRLPGAVTHTFTHFPLELVVYAAEVPRSTPAPADARWLALDDLADAAFPSLMRKVIAHALHSVANGEWRIASSE